MEYSEYSLKSVSLNRGAVFAAAKAAGHAAIFRKRVV